MCERERVRERDREKQRDREREENIVRKRWMYNNIEEYWRGK